MFVLRCEVRRGRFQLAAVAAVIMLAPQLGVGACLLLANPDHIGTSVPILAAWLLLDRAPRRWHVPVIIALMLAWTQVADPLTTVAAAVPLALVCGLRVYQQAVPPGAPAGGGESAPRRATARLRGARYEAALAAAALASIPAAAAALALIRASGGWTENPLHAAVVASADMPSQLWTGTESLLLLFGADIFGQPAGLPLASAALHLIGVGLAAWAVVAGIPRLPREHDLISRLLVTGIITTLAALLLGWHMRDNSSAREIAPVLPMAAALAGRQLTGRLIASRALPALAVVLAANVLALGQDAAQPRVSPANTTLTSWLTAHHLRAGLAPYWQADTIIMNSNGAITMGTVIADGNILAPETWETYKPWYDPRLHYANFLVEDMKPASKAWYATPAEAAATFGPPARTYRYGDYQIQVWNHNLLTQLGHW